MRSRRGPRARWEVAVAADADRLVVLEILKRSTAWLAERGVEGARLDAEILVAHALELTRLDLYLAYDRPVNEAERARLRELLRARARRVPVAYLTGEREFWSLAFAVDERVLVPRPETEHLVEVSLPVLRAHPSPVFADVGCGSGCIAVALAHEVPSARGHGTDVSAGALEVARGNAERHGVAERILFSEGDLLSPVRDTEDWGRLHLVVANPPYVLRTDAEVDPGVREHEPAEAVFVPGDDPLEVARRLARDAREALFEGGRLVLEVGMGSAEPARAVLERLGYVDLEVTPDLAGIDRVVSATWSGAGAP